MEVARHHQRTVVCLRGLVHPLSRFPWFPCTLQGCKSIREFDPDRKISPGLSLSSPIPSRAHAAPTALQTCARYLWLLDLASAPDVYRSRFDRTRDGE